MERKKSAWRTVKLLYRQNLRRPIIDYKWLILLSLACVAFIFGYIGFKKALAGQNYSNLDIAMLSLRLFWFQTASLIQNPPQSLNFARFLAPALTLTTIAFLVLVSLYEHLALWWLRLVKTCHVVVCGLGYIGPVITKTLLDRGYSVVVIESNPKHPEIELMRDQGAFAITGDATKREILEKAGINKARYLFAVTGDDARNIDIFNKVSTMFAKRKDAIPFTCYTHIEDKELLQILGSGELAPFCPQPINNSPPMKYCEDRFFFNIYWIAASCLIRKHPFIPLDRIENLQKQERISDNPQLQTLELPEIHVLIVGIGTYGENLILQIIFEWWVWFGHTGRQIHITILDKEPDKKKKLIKELYPSLYQHCSMETICMEIPSPDFIQGTILIEAHKKSPFTDVYMCFDDDSLSLTTAIHFQQLLMNVEIYITFRTVHSEQFNSLFDQLKINNTIFDKIHSFPLVSNNCCIDNILCQDIDEKLAMSIHYEYLNQQRRAGVTREKNSSCVPWYDLPPQLRDSNRKQAAKLKEYIEITGHKIEPLKEWDTPLYQFSDSEVDILARSEFDRWIKDNEKQETIFSESIAINMKTINWDDLDEDEKEKDRNAIRVIPRLFAGIGLRVI